MSSKRDHGALLVYLLRSDTGNLDPSVVALSTTKISHNSPFESALHHPWRLVIGNSSTLPAETLLAVLPFYRLREVFDARELAGIPAPPFICYGPQSQLFSAYAAGAHDYLRDPWDRDELVCRVERSMSFSGASELERRVADLHLTHTEERLLRALRLGRHSGVSREALGVLCYGGFEAPESRKLDMLISRLRRKLRALPAAPEIRSLRGSGYRLEERSRPEAVDNL